MFNKLGTTNLHKSPIGCRTFGFLLLPVLPLHVFSGTQSSDFKINTKMGITLTVQQTIQYALKNPDFLALMKGKMNAAKGHYIESTECKTICKSL